MKHLKIQEQHDVAGGFHIGGAIMGIATGLIMGGPIGMGVAVAGLIGAQGIDNLVTLYGK